MNFAMKSVARRSAVILIRLRDSFLRRSAKCCDFYLYFCTINRQFDDYGRICRAHSVEIAAQSFRHRLDIFFVDEKAAYSNDISERRIRLRKRLRDSRKNAIHLFVESIGYGTGRSVHSNSSRNEYPVSIYDGPGIGCNIFVYRTG
jgi:hypothetical protein